MQSTFDKFLRNTLPIIMKCELTFRSGRTRPAHARSSGSETLSRIRFLAGSTIDTLESRFRKRQDWRGKDEVAYVRSRTAGVMTTLMRNGRDRRSENPGWVTRGKSAWFCLGPISGSHQGQRPWRLHREGGTPPSENRIHDCTRTLRRYVRFLRSAK